MSIQSKRIRPKSPGINAGSMADVAFLLLIFFLVTTDINEKKAIKVKLPPWSEEAIPSPISTAILNIKLNAAGDLMVEREPVRLNELKNLVSTFILSPKTDDGVRKAKGSGVISLQHESRTSYGKYIGVYDVLQLAYAEIHQAEANARFGQDWSGISKTQRNIILKELPIKISEAEPFTIQN